MECRLNVITVDSLGGISIQQHIAVSPYFSWGIPKFVNKRLVSSGVDLKLTSWISDGVIKGKLKFGSPIYRPIQVYDLISTGKRIKFASASQPNLGLRYLRCQSIKQRELEFSGQRSHAFVHDSFQSFLSLRYKKSETNPAWIPGFGLQIQGTLGVEFGKHDLKPTTQHLLFVGDRKAQGPRGPAVFAIGPLLMKCPTLDLFLAETYQSLDFPNMTYRQREFKSTCSNISLT